MTEGVKKLGGKIIILIIFIVLGLGIGYLIFKPKDTTRYKETEQKQDTLIKKRNEALNNVVNYSNENAKKGNELIKQLPNEEIHVPDTTSNYKFEYIKNYSPRAN